MKISIKYRESCNSFQIFEPGFKEEILAGEVYYVQVGPAFLLCIEDKSKSCIRIGSRRNEIIETIYDSTSKREEVMPLLHEKAIEFAEDLSKTRGYDGIEDFVKL